MSTIRTDGNGTRIIDTNSETEMLKQLRRMASDNEVSKVLVNINDSTIELARPKIGGCSMENGKIGPLVEVTNSTLPFIDPSADVSSLSVIMGNTRISSGSVVMGNVIYKGVNFDNHLAYEKESTYWP